MGNTTDDETVLFLFISFAVLIVLCLILVILSCQTWMLWKMAKAVVEQDAQIRRNHGPIVDRGGVEKRSVRMSLYADGEDESLMSGANGDGSARKKKRGVWGLGRWV
ncbi:hypothetical protein ACN47E_009405 [Coniothyrium glycines]